MKISFSPEDYPYYQLAASFLFLIAYFVSRKITGRLINKHGKRNKYSASRISYVRKIVNAVAGLIVVTLIAITWDISFQGLAIYFASFFTVAGIGLFAQWSILSSITSSVILFFYFPYKIGSKVKIIDGDNSISGTVTNISIFAIHIKTEEGNEVYYPNNLAIQKPIVDLLRK